jgi:hypothetical protein
MTYERDVLKDELSHADAPLGQGSEMNNHQQSDALAFFGATGDLVYKTIFSDRDLVT